MESWDEWLVELGNNTGLSAEQLVDVAQSLDPAYAAIRAERERERRVAEQQAASTRARELLLSHLTDEQRATYTARGSIDVTSSAGRLFRISNGTPYLVEDGRQTVSYCIHPDGRFRVPPEDTVLALKLLLEHDEPEFLRIAHASRA